MPANRASVKVNKADLKNINRKLDLLSKVAGPREVLAAMDKVGKQTVNRMKQEAPVDTGRLRTNVEYNAIHRQSHTDLRFESEAIDPVTRVDYAPIQEHGLNGLTPQPYFFHNVRQAWKELRQELTAAINKALR